MKNLLEASCAVVLSMLVVGCGGADSFPDDSMEINGTVSSVTTATIHYYADWRAIFVENEAGDQIYFDFDSVGLGDPEEPANHFPLETWTAMDSSTFDRVQISDGEGTRSYSYGSSHAGSLRLGGTPGTTLTIEASFEFPGTGDAVRVRYSGAYEYVYWD